MRRQMDSYLYIREVGDVVVDGAIGDRSRPIGQEICDNVPTEVVGRGTECALTGRYN